MASSIASKDRISTAWSWGNHPIPACGLARAIGHQAVEERVASQERRQGAAFPAPTIRVPEDIRVVDCPVYRPVRFRETVIGCQPGLVGQQSREIHEERLDAPSARLDALAQVRRLRDAGRLDA